MYRLSNLADGKAQITNDNPLYDSTFNVADEAEAVRIVVELNQPAMLDELARYRFSFETAGLLLESGLRIKTDRESQGQLANSYMNLGAGLIPDTDWKAANDWQVGGLTEIGPIAKAMAAHVRGCFRGERVVETAIKSATTMAQIEAIDIQAQFMAMYRAAYAEVMTPEQAPE